MSTNINDLKAAIAAKLKENEGKNSPGHLSTGIISNANNISEVKNPYSIVSKDIVIDATKPELPKDVLAVNNASDEKAQKEWLSNLKFSDPARYKIEFAKQQHIDYMKSLVKGYSEAEKVRSERRSK